MNLLAEFNRRQAKGEFILSALQIAVEAGNTADLVARREMLEKWADKIVSPGNQFVYEGIVELGTIIESLQPKNPNL